MRCDYKMDSVIVDKYLSVILQDSVSYFNSIILGNSFEPVNLKTLK